MRQHGGIQPEGSVSARELTLSEVKSVELGILDYIAALCERHGIRYILSYGTLLGAVRHGGFIPWDDDIDLVMSRGEYNRFISAFDREGSARYGILVPGRNGYSYPFIKVYDRRTRVEEENTIQPYEIGVWVDIFPLDGAPASFGMRDAILGLLIRFRCIAAYRGIRCWSLGKRLIGFVPWLVARLIGPMRLLRCIEALAQEKSWEEAAELAVRVEYLDRRLPFSRSLLEDTQLLGFEGREYRAPRDTDTFLRAWYGEYMQLPPVDQRNGHSFRAWWRGESPEGA